MESTDLQCFHATHFSNISVDYFSGQYLGPVEEHEYTAEANDDGLGYYHDGVKRTITNEQIAIFRHSEIQALLRVRQKLRDTAVEPSNSDLRQDPIDRESFEDGELEDDTPIMKTSKTPNGGPNSAMNKKQRKAHEARKRGFFKQNIKPDLRKRTWDMVEQGVGDLAYDEEDTCVTSASGSAIQRRRISYDG